MMTIDHVVSLVIFTIALGGIGVTTRHVRVAWRVLRLLDRTPGADPGVRMITFGHLRSDLVRLYIHAIFIFSGVIQLIPHVRYDPYWWFGLLIVLTMQLLLIYSSIAAGQDQIRAARLYRAR